jgi:hypothetical protein
MEHVLKQIIQASATVVVSSLDTVRQTVQRIQQSSEAPDDGQDTDGMNEGSAFDNASRLALMPFFEISRIPGNVVASAIETLSHSRQKKQGAGATGDGVGGKDPAEDYGAFVPLDEGEAAIEAKVILTEEAEEAYADTLWQIGRSGRDDFEGGWAAVFDYQVGRDLDPINRPGIPHMITVHEGPKPGGATEKLNIHFSLEQGYGEVAFVYDRWGAKKDQVFVDGELLAPVGGAGRGKFRHVALSLKDLSNGDHVIAITTSGETEAGGHRVDSLKLIAVGESVHRGIGVSI